MSPPHVRLRMEAQTTVLEFDDGRTVTLPVGPRGLAETVLRHVARIASTWRARHGG